MYDPIDIVTQAREGPWSATNSNWIESFLPEHDYQHPVYRKTQRGPIQQLARLRIVPC